MPLDLTDYVVAFSDEFADRRLDTSVWATRYWWGGRSLPSNGEMQYFADTSTVVVQKHPGLEPFAITPDPAEPGDGVLTIKAHRSPDTALTDGLAYVSGLINTRGTFSQTYGYFEISAKVPSGQGLWPAFWLLPQSGAWPPEIDVMELLGHEPATYYASTHWAHAGGKHLNEIHPHFAGVDLSRDFHVYGVLWTPETITFYLDGSEIHAAKAQAGIAEPMYLLVGLAVGGKWPGAPDATTRFPAEFQVDYVRAWTRKR